MIEGIGDSMLEYLSSLPGAISLGLIWGIMAIGVYITYRILDIPDLTVDGSFATGAAVCGILIVSGVPFPLALLIGFLAGIVCGLVTGVLHVIFGIPAILAGILTQLMLWSINLKILGGKANLAVSSLTNTVFATQMNVPDSLWKVGLTLAVLIALLYFFFGTSLGASIRATGNNPRMASAQGINVKRNKIIGLALSNGLVALSGGILAQFQGYADVTMGRGAIVIGLAAVIIGEAILVPKALYRSVVPANSNASPEVIARESRPVRVAIQRFKTNFAVRLSGVAVGAIIYYIVYQSVVFLGLDTDLLKMLSALVVVIFLGVPYIRKNVVQKMRRAKAKKRLISGEEAKQ